MDNLISLKEIAHLRGQSIDALYEDKRGDPSFPKVRKKFKAECLYDFNDVLSWHLSKPTKVNPDPVLVFLFMTNQLQLVNT